MLSGFIKAFQGASALILWLQPLCEVILYPKEMKSVTAATFSPICYEVMGSDAMILVFWILSFKPAFSLFFHPHQEDV